VLGDQDRGEAAIAVAWDLHPQRPVIGQDCLGTLAVALIGGLLGALAARRIAQVVAQFCSQGPFDQRLLERHRQVLHRLGGHRAFDELINQLCGNRRQFPQRCLFLGSHTCSLSNMLGPKHKIYDTPTISGDW